MTHSPPATSSSLWRFLSLALKIWLWFGLLAILFTAYLYYAVDQPPKIGEHVSREETPFDLPESATDVCYFNATLHPFTAYEFTVSEADFRAWAERKGMPPEPIEKRDHIRRYINLIADGDDEPASIGDGLRYYWSEEDRITHCAFDRKTSRCYVYLQSR